MSRGRRSSKSVLVCLQIYGDSKGHFSFYNNIIRTMRRACGDTPARVSSDTSRACDQIPQ